MDEPPKADGLRRPKYTWNPLLETFVFKAEFVASESFEGGGYSLGESWNGQSSRASTCFI